jgi:hypothetical protein
VESRNDARERQGFIVGALSLLAAPLAASAQPAAGKILGILGKSLNPQTKIGARE